MSNPFPDHTIEAVGACTRALAGLEYADAAIAQAGAATLSGLRAFGDRLALRARYHDSVIHVRHRPDTPLEAELFDGLEHARLDAIGALRLQGIARNLLAHPGTDPDGPRWLAFEALSQLPAPREKKELIERVRRGLSANLLRQLADLSTLRNDQARFAEAVFEGVQGDLHFVADVHLELTALVPELLDRHDAFGLQAGVDDDGIRADVDDDTDHDGSGLELGQRLAALEQFRKTLSHCDFQLMDTDRAGLAVGYRSTGWGCSRTSFQRGPAFAGSDASPVGRGACSEVLLA